MTYIKLRYIVSSGHLHGMNAPGLDLEIALEPDALHRETQRRLSTGANAYHQPLMLERGYTNLSQLDHLTLRSPDTTSQQSYQYDALGQMSFRSLQDDPAEKVIAYRYDAAGRLIGSQHGDHAHRYSVDAAGNRLEQQDNQQALPDNRLSQLNGTRYRYDGAGNLIERQQPNGERLTLSYDGANRLVHLTHTSELGATREATYRSDGLGRRISKTVRHPNGTTATTHYGWDGDRIVREETDDQRTTVVYEPGSFVPMLRIDDTQQGPLVSAYITDALGTPMQLVTPNGQSRWLAEPDDWAAVKNQRAMRNVTQPIRFQGQWHDEESGLYYNRHRYYDPQQGRYISQDPIGLNGGTNLYGYVTNPTGMLDPLGLFGANMHHLEPFGVAAREAQGANRPAPTPKPAGQHLTGGDYRPGIGALFPSSTSAFAKDPQYAEALEFQGASRNNITLPAASAALGAPMVGAAAPGASSASAAGANQLSLRALCSVATVSPGAAVGVANPGVQGAALDFIDSAVGGTSPTPDFYGAGGFLIDFFTSPKEVLR
ncbi:MULTISPECIES: RHS repeat-associated core domain-containing protein [unclassified Halomonas]|uniref:RHS repeat-associated core domain-containing protein n=1 Tax=unclassified Halomonas TaxID=2609666 RepID=UPI0006D96559|nr:MULTISPECIES: RHS repeat-associated core domain-containing protein [unclassified Halomonas]KPQ20301.1 MAG: Rhs family protein [Halomonas sp. HL-93]SBR45228.1 RHS repeat-associated core domain-containing protein [Halomonas sp. HL-93]SNY97657.1 RHS repeat-associated core domain-containing protein [Halomonas sp. hl-4]